MFFFCMHHTKEAGRGVGGEEEGEEGEEGEERGRNLEEIKKK